MTTYLHTSLQGSVNNIVPVRNRAAIDEIAGECGLQVAGGGYIGGVAEWSAFAMRLRDLLEPEWKVV